MSSIVVRILESARRGRLLHIRPAFIVLSGLIKCTTEAPLLLFSYSFQLSECTELRHTGTRFECPSETSAPHSIAAR